MAKPRFRDPVGHEFDVTEAQASGRGDQIVCPECGWKGTTNDGGTEVIGTPSPKRPEEDIEED